MKKKEFFQFFFWIFFFDIFQKLLTLKSVAFFLQTPYVLNHVLNLAVDTFRHQLKFCGKCDAEDEDFSAEWTNSQIVCRLRMTDHRREAVFPRWNSKNLWKTCRMWEIWDFRKIKRKVEIYRCYEKKWPVSRKKKYPFLRNFTFHPLETPKTPAENEKFFFSR